MTDAMVKDTRELLRLFGLPYVVAEAEAEAQCAVLEELGLVDGVVTDDCDVFLFGAKRVYKNMFDNRKYVERYLTSDLELQLGLDRDKLVCMAMLLGSDYTQGVHGIGIVNAIEVVNAFPGVEGLRQFRLWIFSASQHSKPGRAPLHPGPKATKETLQAYMEARQQFKKDYFVYKHRNIRASWQVGMDFPSNEVIQVSSYTCTNISSVPCMYMMRIKTINGKLFALYGAVTSVCRRTFNREQTAAQRTSVLGVLTWRVLWPFWDRVSTGHAS